MLRVSGIRTFTRFILAVVVLFTLYAAPLYSADKEIFGSASGGRFGDDEGSLGFGPGYGVGLGVHPLPLLGYEFALHGMTHERQTSGGRLLFEGKPVFFTGNLLLHFSGAMIQPFILGGIGVMHYSGTQRERFTDGRPEVVISKRANEFAVNFGAGLKVFVFPHVSIRPEIRYFVSTPGNFNMIQGSIGISLHW